MLGDPGAPTIRYVHVDWTSETLGHLEKRLLLPSLTHPPSAKILEFVVRGLAIHIPERVADQKTPGTSFASILTCILLDRQHEKSKE